MATTTLVPSAARTASADSGLLLGLANANTLRMQLNITAASGTTPTLDVVVEDTLDGGATFNTIATFTQATVASRQVVNFSGLFSDTIRVRWTVGGTTPSFTFSAVLYSEP